MSTSSNQIQQQNKYQINKHQPKSTDNKKLSTNTNKQRINEYRHKSTNNKNHQQTNKYQINK